MQGLPSPARSPSLTPNDNSSGLPTRKRQRSQSMQSDTSSSPKRSVSSGIGSPRSDEKSPLSPSDRDIDAYMAEQDEIETEVQGNITLNTPTQNGINPIETHTPADKLILVNNLRTKPMQVGDTWYVVSRPWYRRWQKACTGEVDKEGGVNEKDLGPVNNNPLVDKDGNLISSAIEGVDVEFVPEEVWSHFTTWFGQSECPIPRKVIARGIMQEPSMELHPPRLKAFVLSKDFNLEVATGPPPRYVCLSSKDSVKTLCTRLAEAVSMQPHLPYRVWKVEGGDFDGSEYPPFKLIPGGASILEETDTTLDEALIESEDSFVVEFKDGTNWIVDAPQAPQSASITLPLVIPPPLFSAGNDFFSRLGNEASVKAPSTNTSKDILPSLSQSSSILLRPAASIDSFGSSNSHHNSLEPGTLGLGNMGNTCFMNSALQCLAHSKELADYFLTGVYREELNPDNPLGMHGAIAEAFGALLRRIWATSGVSSSYSPREFKQQLQRFAPQFSGYQQHDSQELVAFLLDGLHEDLNRVLKKPYVEKPDWEGGGDKELIHLARESWEGYMRRNDSVIVDLFQGQYQSTLICPECQKISITFDPFMYLTLPLPVQKKWRHSICYVPWDVGKPHVKVPVEIGYDKSFKDLRHLLARWMGAQPDHLLTLEIFNHRFYKNLDDTVSCGEMSKTDVIVCFELPCHVQQSRTRKKQPDDPFIIPIFFCDVNPRNSFSRGTSLFGYPSIVVVDQKQATNFDDIYDATVDRLQRWTANARDLYQWEAGSAVSAEECYVFSSGNLVTEISENGDVIAFQEAEAEEADIVDEKSIVIREQDAAMDITVDEVPKRIGAKQGIFNLRLHINHKDYGTGVGTMASRHVESWENRLDEMPTRPVLLREGDAFFCEFDENMKAYYFGDDLSRWEHALWGNWDEFIHPEYEDAKKVSAEKQDKGISLQDCLDEFTKSEELGQDDLWYCPRCKKHQQATKKFDLWKAPDVLVVHLKRFSNSRMLRDKIDTFVDFPLEGLDLGDMVGERQAARRLLAQGTDIAGLDLGNIDKPLVYDLFAVDEHLGGLGGGHYRAYALNHLSEKWYHFDDSFVSPTHPSHAVNANAYLLFYRRRTADPLGGKTHEKIQEALLKPESPIAIEPTSVDNQLPTPPNEPYSSYSGSGLSRMTALSRKSFATARTSGSEGWPTPRSNRSNAGSAGSSPPPLDDPELPSFEDSQFDDNGALDPLQLASHQFDFPDPSSKASPTSSIEAEPDLDYERDDNRWQRQLEDDFHPHRSLDFDGFQGSPEWKKGLSFMASPTGSSVSDLNPFSDMNEQKFDDGDSQDIPINPT